MKQKCSFWQKLLFCENVDNLSDLPKLLFFVLKIFNFETKILETIFFEDSSFSFCKNDVLVTRFEAVLPRDRKKGRGFISSCDMFF